MKVGNFSKELTIIYKALTRHQTSYFVLPVLTQSKSTVIFNWWEKSDLKPDSFEFDLGVVIKTVAKDGVEWQTKLSLVKDNAWATLTSWEWHQFSTVWKELNRNVVNSGNQENCVQNILRQFYEELKYINLSELYTWSELIL